MIQFATLFHNGSLKRCQRVANEKEFYDLASDWYFELAKCPLDDETRDDLIDRGECSFFSDRANEEPWTISLGQIS